MKKDTSVDEILDRMNTCMTNWTLRGDNDKLFARAMTSALLELQIKLAELGIARDWLK